MLNPLTEKFFDEGSKPNLDYIYKEIFSMESSLARPLSKDIFAVNIVLGFKITENEDNNIINYNTIHDTSLIGHR
jgi:hypothetical protein